MITLCHLPTCFIHVLCSVFHQSTHVYCTYNPLGGELQKGRDLSLLWSQGKDSAWNRVRAQYISVKRTNDILQSSPPPCQGHCFYRFGFFTHLDQHHSIESSAVMEISCICFVQSTPC